MSEADNRHISRDSLFILAELRLAGQSVDHRVKVRNLSAGGLMGEGDAPVARGDQISINLRNVGWVNGSIAWVQANRFGVAFAKDIDVTRARAPQQSRPDNDDLFRRKLLSGVQHLPHGPVRTVI